MEFASFANLLDQVIDLAARIVPYGYASVNFFEEESMSLSESVEPVADLEWSCGGGGNFVAAGAVAVEYSCCVERYVPGYFKLNRC